MYAALLFRKLALQLKQQIAMVVDLVCQTNELWRCRLSETVHQRSALLPVLSDPVGMERDLDQRYCTRYIIHNYLLICRDTAFHV